MGRRRREHHRQEEAKRAAGIEATRRRIEMEEANRRFQEQLSAQREAMEAQTKSMVDALTPDVSKTVGGTLGAQNIGIRTARSTRQSVRGLSRGLAALRIPLNIGGGTGGGLNIG
jgi:hypothetical protein